MHPYRFDTLRTTPENQEAVEICRRLAYGDTNVPTPLLILGGAGSGKTHLLWAVANTAAESQQTLNLVLLHPRHFPEAVRRLAGNTAAVAALPRTLLLVDDYDAFGDLAPVLFRVIFAFVAHNQPVVLAGQKSPEEIMDLNPVLRGALARGHCVRLDAVLKCETTSSVSEETNVSASANTSAGQETAAPEDHDPPAEARRSREVLPTQPVEEEHVTPASLGTSDKTEEPLASKNTAQDTEAPPSVHASLARAEAAVTSLRAELRRLRAEHEQRLRAMQEQHAREVEGWNQQVLALWEELQEARRERDFFERQALEHLEKSAEAAPRSEGADAPAPPPTAVSDSDLTRRFALRVKSVVEDVELRMLQCLAGIRSGSAIPEETAAHMLHALQELYKEALDLLGEE